MVSKKVYYQHLYKEILHKIDDLDYHNVKVTEIDDILDKIARLGKKNKRDYLLKRLQKSKNFLNNFRDIFQKEIKELTQANIIYK